MKMTRGLVLIIAIFMGSLLGASSCEEDKPNPGSDVVSLLTANTWVPGTVKHETDGDLTEELYNEFEITFSGSVENPENGGTFTTKNGDNAFPASGTWEFVSDKNFTQIMRGDGVAMDIEVTENNLTLEFTIESTSARMSGASGTFEFDLVAK